MRTVGSVAELRKQVAAARSDGRIIGLVPTMGAFHEGHLSLIRRARADCDVVVVSIFVNPTQFASGEDLEGYPRDEERDSVLAAQAGVDVLFVPHIEEVYPAGFSTSVRVSGLTDTLCGAPGRRGAEHFHGVTTVVTKLFNMCLPDVAYFGAKDYQQALVIKRLVRDLDIPVRIELGETVRDRDGLALSSRNAYLSEAERARALSLKRSLDAARQAISDGATTAREVADAAIRALDAAGVEPEYVEVVSARDLSPLDRLTDEDVLIAVAARIGRARLIDNTVVASKAVPHAAPATDHSVARLSRRPARTSGSKTTSKEDPRRMQRQMLKSKIHRATVTGCDLHYAGSITIDSELMREADLLPHELVQVLDIDNGSRFETYVIEGQPGSGEVQINGAAVRLVQAGDKVIIVAYALYTEDEIDEQRPRVVHVDSRNRVVRVDADSAAPVPA